MKYFAILYTLLFTLTSSLVFGQAKLVEVSKTNKDANIAFNKYTLPNGLTILLHNTEAFGNAAHVEVKYHVGSAREQKGKSGFAHLFEHLMFQGSKHVKNDEHFQIIQAYGGEMNGTTNTDRTNYYQTVPSSLIETALWLEADRMGFLLDSVTQEKLDNQREVVKNERLQRYDNKPYGLNRLEFQKAFYPEGHPYSWPTIGYMKDLNSANLTDVQKFFLRWYGANNATLAVVGHFEEKDVIGWIEKYFSEIPTCPNVYSDKQIPVEFEDDQILISEENVSLPMLTIGFPTVDFNHDDYLPLQALAYVLAGSKSSFITKNIVDKGFAQEGYVYQNSKELAGEFMFKFLAPEDQSLMVLESLFKASLFEFEKKGASLIQLEAFKALKEKEIKNRGSSLNAISRTLTYGEIFKSNANYSQNELEKLRRLSYNALERVYNTYIKGKPALYQAVYPKGKKEKWNGVARFKPKKKRAKFVHSAEYDTLTFRPTTTVVNRNIHPNVPKSKPSKIFDFKTERWKNGIDVISSTNFMAKSNFIDIHLPAGKKYEKNGTYGISIILKEMFKEGSLKFPAKDLFDKLETMGATLTISSNYDDISFHMTSPDQYVNTVISLIYDLINNPAFNQKDFDRIKKKQIQRIKQKEKNPKYLATKHFNASIYGDQFPKSHPQGRVSDLERITLSDVKQYFREQIGNKGSRIVYSGRLPLKAYKSGYSLFKNWDKFVADALETPYPKQVQPKLHIIDVPKAPQVIIKMGTFLGMYDRLNSAYPLYKLSHIPFGGQFSSRLNMNLREDKGYTYGVRSSFIGSGIENVFHISSSVKADKLGESLDEIIREINEVNLTGLTNSELDNIVDQEISKMDLNTSSLAKKHQLLNQIQKRNLSKKSFKKWHKKLSKFDVYDFNTYLRTLLAIDNFQIVLVGDEKQIRKELKWMDENLVQSIYKKDATGKGKVSDKLWPASRKTKWIKGVEYPIYKAKDFNTAFKQAKKELGVSKKAKFIWNNSIYTTSIK
ncbi:MAG: M16 family metallopeptidase [Flavobacteriales bacterium]